MEDTVSMPGYTQYGGRPTQAGPAQPSEAPYPGLQPGVPAYPGMQQVPPQPAVSAEKRGGKMASWISLVCGIIGLVIVGATVFVMWEMMNDPATRSDPSGADIIGFFPLFAFIFMGPVNTLGFVTGIMGVALTPKAKTVVGWLGLLLNAAPYVAFVATIWLIP